uniref:TSC22 domain family protein 1 n=1 Tax=Globodera pallida TaxID=36090 RepID=A0A183BKK6_GLOPA
MNHVKKIVQFPSVVVQTNQQQQTASTSVSNQIHQQRVPKPDFSANSCLSNFDISPTHSVPIALDSDYVSQGSSALDLMANAIGGKIVTVSSSMAYPSPIDNKIEQALDLVKTQLTLAVRKEMKLMRSTIIELESKVSLLEGENRILRQYAPNEVEANLPALVQQMRDRQQKGASASHNYLNQSRTAPSSLVEHHQTTTSGLKTGGGASPPCPSVANTAWDGRVKQSEIKSDFGRNGM